MFNRNRYAKINVKVLIILIIVTVALGASLFAARQIRRNLLSKISLNEGNAAYEKKDWEAAYKNFQEYLGRNPDDIEVLRKYAKARMSVRPIESPNIMQAIAGYRRILQLDPSDETAYEELIRLYSFIGNFDEMAYIARNRLADDPNDWKATLKLAEALYGQNKTKEAQEELKKITNTPKSEVPSEFVEEYVRACGLLSQIIYDDVTNQNKSEALTLLNQAVEAAEDTPESVEARAYRARYYHSSSQKPGQSEEDVQKNMERAREDLEEADKLGTENPRIRLLLAEEWIAHGELDKAAKELQAADDLKENLPEEKLEEYFFDIADWTVARFMLASRLAGLKGDMPGAIGLVDKVLEDLTDIRHRVHVLPTAIMSYVSDPNRVSDANELPDANECLDEYTDAIYTQQGQSVNRQAVSYLQALVARGKGNPYGVINALQPFVTSGASSPEVWRLLAEAFIRTDQTRRAVNAIIQSEDPEMTLLLAKEYLKLQDWTKALEIAQMAESSNPTDIALKLLRIQAGINVSVENLQENTPNQQALANDVWTAKATELSQIRTKHPDRVDIRILQSIVALQLKDPNTAENQLKQAIEDCNEPLRAEIQLVRFYRQQKRMDEAISACKSACDRHPEIAEPWLTLSDLHVGNKDYESARNCLNKALDVVTERWEKRSISINLALLELTRGENDEDLDKGIKILSDLAAQDKNEIRARTLLLATRKIQEDPNNRAQELIDELKEAEGQTGLQWRLNQARVWLASEEWRSKQQDIAGHLQYCIDMDPQWPAPVLLLANMYDVGKLNELGRVEDICRQALTHNPSAPGIIEKLVTTLERQGRLSDAEEVLKQPEADSQLSSRFHIRTALRA
ncbi:MAG TPA: hypothetical protein DIU00_11195, partial [Phycisphaerales bacterium]|nr:hypothetical protein [Phycisphaerales bacterium]